MSFRYVDRIYNIDSNEIEAIKLLTRQEPYWVWFDGKKYINPCVLVESFVQLLIWDRAYTSQFSKINLVKNIEEINFYQKPSFSDKLYIEVEKKNFNASFIKETYKNQTSSSKIVVDIKGVNIEEQDLDNYFYRSKMIALMKNLYRADLREDELINEKVFRYKDLYKNIENVSFHFIDGVYELGSCYIKGVKNFSASEEFFEESKNKIAPVSIILMTALEFCCFLKKQDIKCMKREDLDLVGIRNLSIKNHIRQGDEAIFIVEAVDEKTMNINVRNKKDEEFFNAKFLFR